VEDFGLEIISYSRYANKLKKALPSCQHDCTVQGLGLSVHSLLTKVMVTRQTLRVVYMLHRVIFDQHRPLICGEIVHKRKQVKRMSTAKKGKVVAQSLSSPSPAVIGSISSSSHCLGGLPSLLPATIHVTRLNRMQAFSHDRYLTSSTKTHPKGGEEDGCSQHQRSCLLSHILVVAQRYQSL
jgi:hypothetical protein